MLAFLWREWYNINTLDGLTWLIKLSSKLQQDCTRALPEANRFKPLFELMREILRHPYLFEITVSLLYEHMERRHLQMEFELPWSGKNQS